MTLIEDSLGAYESFKTNLHKFTVSATLSGQGWGWHRLRLGLGSQSGPGPQSGSESGKAWGHGQGGVRVPVPRSDPPCAKVVGTVWHRRKITASPPGVTMGAFKAMMGEEMRGAPDERPSRSP